MSKTDFLDKCIAHHFKATGDKTAFYPWATFSNGFILPDHAKKATVTQFLKVFYIVFLIAVVISLLSDFALLVAVVVIGGLWYWAHTSMLVKGLSSTEKLPREPREPKIKAH